MLIYFIENNTQTIHNKFKETYPELPIKSLDEQNINQIKNGDMLYYSFSNLVKLNYVYRYCKAHNILLCVSSSITDDVLQQFCYNHSILLNVVKKINSEAITNIYNCFRKLLEKSVYVVGKASFYEKKTIHNLFSKICFIKCPCIYDKKYSHEYNSSKYICAVTPDFLNCKEFKRTHNLKNIYICYLQYKKYGKLYKDKRDNLYKKYLTTHNISNLRTLINTSECEYGYDVAKLEQGWMSTGVLTLFYFSKIFEHIYVDGFSHFDDNGSPIIPSGKLCNPYNNRGGFHSNEFEHHVLTNIIKENGNIFCM